jgi:transposase
LRALYLSQGRMFVSIDETSFGRNGLNTKGYSPIGQKLYVPRKTAYTKTTSAVVCVSNNGIVGRKLVSGSFNRVLFLEFLQSLHLDVGTVVLLDNVSFHHSKEVVQWFANAGLITLYTPPYSPWYNPIELCFSIIKRRYYQSTCIEDAFSSLTTEHCQRFFRKSLATTSAF